MKKSVSNLGGDQIWKLEYQLGNHGSGPDWEDKGCHIGGLNKGDG